MRKLSLGTACPLVLAFLASACQTVPVIPDPLPCPISDAILKESCSKPSTLPGGLTYSDLINALKEDRNALVKCAAHDQQLKSAIQDCNAELEKYKQRLHEIKK
jgi:hypothetical protein